MQAEFGYGMMYRYAMYMDFPHPKKGFSRISIFENASYEYGYDHSYTFMIIDYKPKLIGGGMKERTRSKIKCFEGS